MLAVLASWRRWLFLFDVHFVELASRFAGQAVASLYGPVSVRVHVGVLLRRLKFGLPVAATRAERRLVVDARRKWVAFLVLAN
jgi:hypothetical protein